MRIGLDIDNVIANFDEAILKEFLLEDKFKRNTGVINKELHMVKGMFDWSKDEIKEFFINNMERIAKSLNPIKNAKYYIDKLLNKGFEIYLISHRVYPHYNNPFPITEKWLKEHDINYTKLILSKDKDKSLECQEHDIDIFFDDSFYNCNKLLDSNINCYMMGTNYNNPLTAGIPYTLNWRDLYEKVCTQAIKNMTKEHIILDTDANNEADDQFALAYALKSSERLILEAVTIVPYSQENGVNISAGLTKSYNTCKDIFKLLGIESDNMIYKGSSDYLINGYDSSNCALTKMIEIINKNISTTIIAIGALTNVGLLLKKYPELVGKIKVIWLGGHNLLTEDNYEYNFKQDLVANRIVFESGVDLTVIPCNGVAANLVTTVYELENYFEISHGLGKYLYDKFYNDGRHGITKRRVIWDISAVGYAINPYWFDTFKIKCPYIDDDLKYISSNFNHEITFVNKINVNMLYDDMFKKIGDKYDNDK